MPATPQQLVCKFIASALESTLETDVLSLLNCNCHTDSTPIIQSLLRVWQNGQTVDVSIDEWYAFQHKMVLYIKTFAGNPLVNCLRVALADELCDAHIYMDLSEKLALYAAFVYAALHDDETAKPLVCFVDQNVGYVECLCVQTESALMMAMEAIKPNA